MNVTKNLCRILAILIWALVPVALHLATAASLHAQSPGDGSPGLADNETTVWLVDAPTLPDAQRDALLQGLDDALTSEQGRHVLGEQEFRGYVKGRRPAAPSCLYGQDQCISSAGMAFEVLDLALVVRVKMRRANGQFEAAYRVIDRRDQSASGSDRVVQAPSPRDLAVALVREIYDATGLVSFTSDPSGARVLIDGAQVGTTPLEYRLPIGRHRYTIEQPQYRSVNGEVEVSAKTPAKVSADLALTSGILVLEQAPPGAIVTIEGREEPVSASQPIELEPGEYTYTVSAKGYSSIEDTVTIEPGLNVRREADLQKLNALLRDIPQDSIVYNRYIFRVNFDQSFQNTSFRGARSGDLAAGGDRDLVFDQFVSDGSSEIDPKRFFSTGGLRLDLEYSWRIIGLGLLSVSYLTDGNRNYAANVIDLEGGTTMMNEPLPDLEVTRLTRLQLQPFQIFARYFYKNIVPTVKIGLGLNFQWLTLTETAATAGETPETFVLRQTDAFWTMEFGAQYFFTPNWFASLRYNFHDHFNLGVGTEHAISFGVGGAFPNLFGFEPEPPEQL